MATCYLTCEEHIPRKAMWPVVDAHNHLWAAWESVEQVVRILDEVGVISYCDLTANSTIAFGDGGYTLGAGDMDRFLGNCAEPYPGRFYGFTTALFSQPTDRPLVTDWPAFVESSLEMLRDHVDRGARGLKVLKELGLKYTDGEGRLVRVDDERLGPIWEEAGRLGVPVLIHQSDPVGFFEPIVPENEHYESLLKYPSWSFADPAYPRKAALIENRDRLVRNHPDTVFMLPHVANFAEDLEYVSTLLDENDNVHIDFSARIDELGRQPYSARDFLIRYQDRIYFGTDMPASAEMYRAYFRFLETYDEAFVSPDYDGTFDRHRWRICGVGLPPEVLRKIYFDNALMLIPGLADQVEDAVASWSAE